MYVRCEISFKHTHIERLKYCSFLAVCTGNISCICICITITNTFEFLMFTSANNTFGYFISVASLRWCCSINSVYCLLRQDEFCYSWYNFGKLFQIISMLPKKHPFLELFLCSKDNKNFFKFMICIKCIRNVIRTENCW